MQLFHSYTYTHTHTATALVVSDDSSIFCFGTPVRVGAGRGRLQQPAATKMSERSPWRSVKTWAQHIHHSVLSSQAQSLCSLSFSPLNSPVCSAALTSLQESHSGALSPTMSPSTMPHCSHAEREDHGLLSPLLRVVLVFAASIMLLCIYAAIMWITALFLQIHLKISSLLR